MWASVSRIIGPIHVGLIYGPVACPMAMTRPYLSPEKGPNNLSDTLQVAPLRRWIAVFAPGPPFLDIIPDRRALIMREGRGSLPEKINDETFPVHIRKPHETQPRIHVKILQINNIRISYTHEIICTNVRKYIYKLDTRVGLIGNCCVAL